MKHIKKIVLENFQSHKHTEINLNENLNIIVGPSDSGKTAILRAIKWVLYNEPAGDFFIREGEREAIVKLLFSDNTEVVRIRSKSKNVYLLKYNNGDELRLEGFGIGVPQEVKEAIGIYKISLDSKENNSINLAEQLEGPFLLSEKTSTRASAIGQLVGVDVIDEALGEVLKDTRSLNVTKKNLEEEIANLDKEIKTYEFLEKLKITTAKVIDIREKLFESQDLLESLEVRDKLLKELNSKIAKLENIKNSLNKVNEIEEILNALERNYSKHWQFTNYMKNLQKVSDDIISNTKILDVLKSLDNIVVIENELLEVVAIHKRLLNDKNRYKEINDEIIILNKNKTQLEDYLKREVDLEEIEKVYVKLHKLLKLKDEYYEVKSSINKGNKYMKKFNSIEELKENTIKLEEKAETLRNLNKLYGKRITIGRNSNEEKQNLNKAQDESTKLINKYKSILNSIEKCPLCFSKIDSNKIEHIVDHYIGG